MKYKLYLDTEGYLIGFEHTGTVEDLYIFDPNKIMTNYLNCYKPIGNEIVLDSVKYEKVKQQEREEESKPTQQEKLEAQVLYTALMTDTMLESEDE